jgi:hypothetical protein
LDINTLRALEEGLENFAGCAVVISHDRWFLDRICTHILAFEGDSQVYFFEGGFSDYEENKIKRFETSDFLEALELFLFLKSGFASGFGATSSVVQG